jgi:hypothetical protein
MTAIGQWNTASDPRQEIDSVPTDPFFAAGAPVYASTST